MKKPVAKSGKINLRQISKLYREILIAIGEDAEREGLRGTPDRCARVWAEFINYDPGNTDVTFETIDTDQMIAVSGIEAWSFCEHHLLPFRCSIAIGIVPESKRVLGLSKYARVALQHAHRLQIQERLTGQIADEIQALTHCRSVAVVIDGQHLCAVMRGVKSNNTMHTAAMRGSFMESAEARAEFYRLIRRTV
jgi:GTP cyclohydrolase IA